MGLSVSKIGQSILKRTVQATALGSAIVIGTTNAENKTQETNPRTTQEQLLKKPGQQIVLPHLLPKIEYPPTKKSPFTEDFHGIKITDNYAWLQDANNKDVKKWTEIQNLFTRQFLDSFPKRNETEEKAKKLFETGSVGIITVKENKEFQWRRESNQNLKVLYVKDRTTGKEEVVIDPNKLSQDGTTTVPIAEISSDGKFMAYSVTEAGREQSGSTLKIRNLETKQDLPYTIPHTKFTSIAWLKNNSGFYYSRHPEPGTVPKGEEFYHKKIYFHKLGNDYKKDSMIFAPKNFTDWTVATISEDGNWLTFISFLGAEKNDAYIARLNGSPEKLEIKPLFINKNNHLFPVVYDNYLYMQTNLNAPKGKVIRISLNEKNLSDMSKWEEVVKENKNATLDMFSLQVAGGKLVLNYTENVQSKLKTYDLKTKREESIPLPTIGTVTRVNGKEKSSELFYTFESFTVPNSIYKVDLNTLKQEKISETKVDLDFSNTVVNQVTYTSKDGTKVPMFLVHKKDLVKNGQNKVQLYGYGGFGISITPMFNFRSNDMLWIEKGNVFAIANIRGGGELGEQWHLDGILEKRQNAYDDFIAAAKYLIKEGYTQPEKLAIRGASNGGLLVGAVSVQRPDLFGAVVSQVPLMDMLHYHKGTVAKLWMSEYGDPGNPEHFKFLYKYSPYHNVKDNTKYPAMLIQAGEGDERVDPMHAKKMVARLQAASGSNRPILLLTYPKVGHGPAAVQNQIQEMVDIQTFLEKTLK